MKFNEGQYEYRYHINKKSNSTVQCIHNASPADYPIFFSLEKTELLDPLINVITKESSYLCKLHMTTSWKGGNNNSNVYY